MPNGNVKGVPQSQADKYKLEQICKEELLLLHNLFAFIVTPVHSDYPAFPVHLHFTTQPAFNDIIATIIEIIITELRTQSIHVIGLSYDGELNQKVAYTNQFFNYLFEQRYKDDGRHNSLLIALK